MFANAFMQEMRRKFLKKMKHLISSCSDCSNPVHEIPKYFFPPNFLNKMSSFSYSELWFRAFLGAGEGKDNILKKIL